MPQNKVISGICLDVSQALNSPDLNGLRYATQRPGARAIALDPQPMGAIGRDEPSSLPTNAAFIDEPKRSNRLCCANWTDIMSDEFILRGI